jgi:N-hydroxyarylamine O-acetyltransferase
MPTAARRAAEHRGRDVSPGLDPEYGFQAVPRWAGRLPRPAEASRVDVDAYLARIGYRGSRDPTAATLRALHRAHMERVPFENLDIHAGRPIVLEEEALFDKIVRRRRGGFCYELNGLFSALLREMGFRVARLSAGVLNDDGTFGPDFDHMILRVDLGDRWLADVGFGDSFREPLRLDVRDHQVRDGRPYRVLHDGAAGMMVAHWNRASAPPGYAFDFDAHLFVDYAEMCTFHQTSPDSPFTRKRVCSRATPTGRITLSGTRLIVTEKGQRTERDLTEAEWSRALKEYFGIDPAEVRPRRQASGRRAGERT